MASPVALLGVTSQKFTDQVFSLRQEIRSLNLDEESDQLLTVPHLTLAFHKDFNLEKSLHVKALIEPHSTKVSPFSIHVLEYAIKENNIAAIFDNSQTRKMAKYLVQSLEKLGFEVVVTDHMRLIRSHIKTDQLEKTKEMVENVLPKEIPIEGIALAGKLLCQEDILWQIRLS